MRKIVDRELWIGNAGDLRDARSVCDAGIEAVVELADNEAFAVLPRDLIRCRFPLSDGGENAAWLLKLAAQTMTTLLESGVPTLVCCSAGMSRSVCVVAAGISLANRTPFPEALAQICDGGAADVTPYLFEQMKDAMIAMQIET